jgi:ATP-dependent metalloprotease
LPASILKSDLGQLNRAVSNATRMLDADPNIALNIARIIPKGFNVKPITQQQRRTLFNSGGSNRIVNYRRLNKLEQEANASPTDTLKQATLYKVNITMHNILVG